MGEIPMVIDPFKPPLTTASFTIDNYYINIVITIINPSSTFINNYENNPSSTFINHYENNPYHQHSSTAMKIHINSLSSLKPLTIHSPASWEVPRPALSAAALDALLLHRQLIQGLPQPIDGFGQAMLKDLAGCRR